MSDLDFTVHQATRQLGCSPAKIRSWIQTGKLTAVDHSRPLLLDRDSVLRARAQLLAEIDDVVDLNAEAGRSASARHEAESARLRQQLRAVVASLESFDDGLHGLRAAQRILLENLLGELQDVRPIEA